MKYIDIFYSVLIIILISLTWTDLHELYFNTIKLLMTPWIIMIYLNDCLNTTKHKYIHISGIIIKNFPKIWFIKSCIVGDLSEVLIYGLYGTLISGFFLSVGLMVLYRGKPQIENLDKYYIFVFLSMVIPFTYQYIPYHKIKIILCLIISVVNIMYYIYCVYHYELEYDPYESDYSLIPNSTEFQVDNNNKKFGFLLLLSLVMVVFLAIPTYFNGITEKLNDSVKDLFGINDKISGLIFYGIILNMYDYMLILLYSDDSAPSDAKFINQLYKIITSHFQTLMLLIPVANILTIIRDLDYVTIPFCVIFELIVSFVMSLIILKRQETQIFIVAF